MVSSDEDRMEMMVESAGHGMHLHASPCMYTVCHTDFRPLEDAWGVWDLGFANLLLKELSFGTPGAKIGWKMKKKKNSEHATNFSPENIANDAKKRDFRDFELGTLKMVPKWP